MRVPLPGFALAAAAAGLLTTAAQTALLSELIIDAAGDELALGLGLAVWLVAVAGGAAAARRLAPEQASPRAAALLALLGLCAPAAVVAGRLLRLAWAPPAGELPGTGLALALAAATLLPAGLLAGALFTALAAGAAERLGAGRAPARVYALEAAGSALGGAAVTAASVAGVAPLATLLAAGVVATAAGWLALRGLPLAAAAGCLLAFAPAVSRVDAWSERLRFAGTAPGVPLVATARTPHQQLAIAGDEPRSLYASGQWVATFPDPYTDEPRVQLLAVLAAAPRRVLALPGLETGLLRPLLSHPVEEVVLLEPDPRAAEFVARFLPPADRLALSDPRVRVVNDDPRRFLAHGNDRFDLILWLVPDPVTLLSARLATAEAFAAAARRLAPGGVLVLPARTAPLVVTAQTAALAGSLLGALASAFPEVKATPGPATLLVAGARGDVTLDPERLAARWRARGVIAPAFAPELFPLLLDPGRVAATEEALRAAARLAPPARDDRPASLVPALARRQEETRSRGAALLGAVSQAPAIALVLVALAPALVALGRTLARGRRGARPAPAVHALAATGAASMAGSLLLLLSYQARAGALVSHLGLLTALFMGGLAAGTRVGERGADRPSALARHLAAAAAGLALLPLLLATLLATPSAPALALALHGALLAAAGALGGAVVPAAAHALAAAPSAGPAASASLVEAADHAGAAAAALLAAVVYVPRLGFGLTAGLAAGLLALASFAVLAAGSTAVRPRRPGSSACSPGTPRP